MIRVSHILALSLAALAASAQAAPSVRDFQLPPSNPTPTPSPNVQGPVDTEGPVPVRPRAIPTPTPTASAPVLTTPAPIATPTPRFALAPRSGATPIPRTAPPATSTNAQPSAPAAALPGPTAGATPAPGPALPTLPPAAAPTLPSAAPTLAEPDSGFALWPWLLALVVALGAGALLHFRRGSEARYAEAPQIELPPVAPRMAAPKPAPTPAPAPGPAQTQPASPTPPTPRAASASPLALEAVPVQLSRSMMNATFAYRLTLANRGETALENIAIGADLVTAHSSVPMEQQVSRGDTPLPEMGRIGSIAPGEKVEVEGELRLPLTSIRTVRQGKAQLYVPLLRVRASAPGMEASARTFVVGTLPQDGGRKLQPFRLDEMPQTYRSIGTMALD